MKKTMMLLIIFALLVQGSSFAYEENQPSGWAMSLIEALITKDVLSDELFVAYQEEMTRAEFARLTVELYIAYNPDHVFDVSQTHFDDSDDLYVLQAASVGITSGKGDQKFAPDLKLNREEMAIMLVKTLQLSGENMTAKSDELFSDDASISSWAKEYVYIAKANNFVSGVGNNAYKPKGVLTKEQTLVVINNILDQVILPEVVEENFDSIATYKSDVNTKIFTTIDGDVMKTLDKNQMITMTAFDDEKTWGRTVNNSWVKLADFTLIETSDYTGRYYTNKALVNVSAYPSVTEDVVMTLGINIPMKIDSTFYNDSGEHWGGMVSGLFFLMTDLSPDKTVVEEVVEELEYERALFPMTTLNLSQGVNGDGVSNVKYQSHNGQLAIDIVGTGQGIEDAYAPFTGRVMHIYEKQNVVWFQSENKVLYADGTIDYMTVEFMHDDDISDLKVGQLIKQGDVFYQEGRKGYTTGAHIHIEVGRGKFSHPGWFYKASIDDWVIKNEIHPADAFFIKKGTGIIEDLDYNWHILK